MENPTSAQFKKVINNFILINSAAIAEAEATNIAPIFDMAETGLVPDADNLCGTPMCHGGWYAASIGLWGSKVIHSYAAGASAIAAHLGFNNVEDLREWASNNANLWGNIWGRGMFYDIDAFDQPETLTDIINHWIKVHNRTCKQAKPLELI